MHKRTGVERTEKSNTKMSPSLCEERKCIFKAGSTTAEGSQLEK